MPVSKVIFKSSAEATPEVWIDTTQKTVTAGSMLDGVTALKNDGSDITGNISVMTLPTSTDASATSGYTSKATVNHSASDQYVNIPPGYNSTGGYYKVNAVANGSVTAPSTISGSSATVSTGTNTLTLSKTVSVTPNVTTAGYISSGTAGNTDVSLTANVNTRNSDSLSASGATVTAPAGYYASDATKSVDSMTLPTSTTSSATSGYTSKATVSRSTSDQYINIPTGYNASGAYYKVNAVANGSVTAPTSISGTSATVSTGTNTLTLTKTVSVTPNVTTAGYISSGTAGNASVSLTANVNTRDSSSLTVSGDTVTAPAGYYSSSATKSVASGTEGTPTASKGTVSNHSVTITPSVTNTSGYISGGTKTGTGVTVNVSELESGTKEITKNGTGISVSGYSKVDVAVSSTQPNLQAKTNISPTTSSQTISADSGYDGLSSVQINAMPSGSAGTPVANKGSVSNHQVSIIPTVLNQTGYITGSTEIGLPVTVSASELVSGTKTITASGDTDVTNYATASVEAQTLPTSTSSSATSGYSSKATIGRSTSDRYINIPTGYNAAGAYYKISAVANGTAGTPTATKGTVSNHSISVTPSVTNTTGYITGSTKTGTAVTVTASELVSGSETKTTNGTYIVTNLAQLIVNVAGGGLTYEQGTYKPTSDIARPTISFANSHSTTPILVMMSDTSSYSSITSDSNTAFTFFDMYRLTGVGFPYSTSSERYALAGYVYRSSSSSTGINAQVLYNSDNAGASSTTYSRYWVTESAFYPNSNSESRYWRSGRTYKWIAVWGP